MDNHLSSYKIFYTTANAGNISKAAKELYISQPAISKSISKLEKNLETKLFKRNSKGVTLTYEGTLLYEQLEIAFRAIHYGEEQLKRISGSGTEHIKIGVSTTLCKYMLLPNLKEFMRSYPNIQITLKCQSTRQTLSLLESSEIDLGLIVKPSSNKNLTFSALTQIEDTFVTTPEYFENLLLQNFVRPEHIFRSATLMLLDKNNMTRQHIDKYLSDNHLETNNIMEMTTMDLLIDFAETGMGIACVARNFIKSQLKAGTLIEIPLPAPIQSREVGFAYPKSMNPTCVMKSFMTFFMTI